MDFKQLEAFVQVARFGSFSRAAEHLFLTQPTISAQIKTLEDELGICLMMRAAKGVCLTEKGTSLYGYAMELLSLRDHAIAACSGLDGAALSGTVAVAASTVPCQHVLPQVTAAFREKHPAVVFALTCRDSAGVVEEVLAGKAEIGLTGTVLKDAKLNYHGLVEDELVVAAPQGCPWDAMRGETLHSEDLLKIPFIIREPGSGTRRELEAYLEKRRISPNSLQTVAQMDNPDAIKNAVAQGLGIAVLSKLSCAEDVRLGKLKVFRLEGERMMRRLYLVRHTRRMLSRIAEAFYRFVVEDVN